MRQHFWVKLTSYLGSGTPGDPVYVQECHMTTMERLEEGVYSYTRILLSYPDTQVLVMETPDTILKKLHT